MIEHVSVLQINEWVSTKACLQIHHDVRPCTAHAEGVRGAFLNLVLAVDLSKRGLILDLDLRKGATSI